MRLAFALVVVAACGTEEGAILTIRAPAGPDNVARLEIVLANPDKTMDVDFQRVMPTSATMTEKVRYYRQLATAGNVEAVGKADGFSVRLEKNVIMTTATTFVPFLIAYDKDANVIGVGAMLDEQGEPSTIEIIDTGAQQYFIDMVALRPMDLAQGMNDGESVHVQCGGERKWTSGIAWRPGTTQLRLLLPDRSEDETAHDATERIADLDCDGSEAMRGDCDDIRGHFHSGAQEACDGQDMNCDGSRVVVQSCPNTACTNGGVQLCDDRTGQPISTCQADASCACDGAGGNCNFCQLTHRMVTNGNKAPCAPGIGKMKFPLCTAQLPCTIEVLGATGPWVGYISTLGPPNASFTTKLTNVINEVFIEVKLSGASDFAKIGGQSVGGLNLGVTQADALQLVTVDLQLAEAPSIAMCQPIAGSTNTFAMTCSP